MRADGTFAPPVCVADAVVKGLTRHCCYQPTFIWASVDGKFSDKMSTADGVDGSFDATSSSVRSLTLRGGMPAIAIAIGVLNGAHLSLIVQQSSADAMGSRECFLLGLTLAKPSADSTMLCGCYAHGQPSVNDRSPPHK